MCQPPNPVITLFGEKIMNQAIFNLLPSKAVTWWAQQKSTTRVTARNLSNAQLGREYIIKDILTDDQNMVSFLFSLGCFKGQSITVISVLSENYVITVKDARYSIDVDLAKAVVLV